MNYGTNKSPFGLTELPKETFDNNYFKGKNYNNELTNGSILNYQPLLLKRPKISLTDEQLIKTSPSDYPFLTEEQMRRLSNLKNTEILQLNEENQKSKIFLNKLIKKLNDLIEQNSIILYNTGINPKEDILQKLNELYEQKQKELEISKKSSAVFMAQYEALSQKLNENAHSKVKDYFPIQETIEKIQNENIEISKKISELKNINVKQSKEIDYIKGKEKYKKQIKNNIKEVGDLSIFKYEYYQKLNLNKKSLENEKKELSLLEIMINKINEENNASKNNTIKIEKLNEWLKLLKDDLAGSTDEIFERCGQGKSKIINYYDKKFQLSRNSLKISGSISHSPQHLPMIRNESSYHLYLKNQTNTPMKSTISLKRSESSLYSVKNSHLNPNFKINQGLINKKVLNDSFTDLTDLTNKKKQYCEVNSRIEKQLGDITKNYKNKIKNLSSSIDLNSKKLTSIIQHNELLKNEINGLEKIYSLTKEKIKIKSQLLPNEFKYKSQNISINQNYDNSYSGNDLINELKYIQREEEKIQIKNKNNFLPSKFIFIIKNIGPNIMEHDMSRNKKIIELKNKYLKSQNDAAKF